MRMRGLASRRRRRKDSLKVQGLFGLGVPELVVIAGVTALIFGPKKLPEIGKSLGKTVKSFQQVLLLSPTFDFRVKNNSTIHLLEKNVSKIYRSEFK